MARAMAIMTGRMMAMVMAMAMAMATAMAITMAIMTAMAGSIFEVGYGCSFCYHIV